MHIKLLSLLFILTLSQLSACGQRGDLYLPEDAATISAETEEEKAKTE